MSAAVAKTSRLIEAFEFLVDEEAVMVGEGNFETLGSVQDRIGELLEAIVALPVGPGERERIFRIVNRREDTRLELVRRSAGTRLELDRVRSARARLRGVAPAYAAAARRDSRFVSAA